MLKRGWKQVVSDREAAQWAWTLIVFSAALVLVIAWLAEHLRGLN